MIEKVKKMRETGMSINSIAKELNRCTDTIREYLVELGYLTNKKRGGGRKRKYDVDDNFFDKIDTEEKSYILGLIFADGCVHKRNQFSITLKSSDDYILNQILICMKSNFPIIYFESQYSKEYIKTNKSRLHITSKRIIDSLYKLGCVQRKSDILKFPNIPEKLLNHFMRGYFDGDGSVYITNKNEICVGIISTKEFCDVYLNNLPYGGKVKPRKDYRLDKNVYEIKIGGKNQVKKILDFLYKDSTIYLERKKNIYDNFFI